MVVELCVLEAELHGTVADSRVGRPVLCRRLALGAGVTDDDADVLVVGRDEALGAAATADTFEADVNEAVVAAAEVGRVLERANRAGAREVGAALVAGVLAVAAVDAG